MKVYIAEKDNKKQVYGEIIKIIDNGSYLKFVDDCGFKIKKKKDDIVKIIIEE